MPKLVSVITTVVALLAFLLMGNSALAQGGPSPEVLAHMTALVDAINQEGSAAWEAMSKVHFAPSYLSSETAEQREAKHQAIRAMFGTVSLRGLRRAGPNAPIEVGIAGGNGSSGALLVELAAESPFLIRKLAIKDGGGTPANGTSAMPDVPKLTEAMPPQEIATALNPYLRTLTSRDRFSGAVLVARRGEVVYENAFGMADRARQIPLSVSTRFNLASIGKIFTRTAIAQLVQADKLNYDTTLGDLLPDYPQAETRAATIRQLLDHKAGVVDFFNEKFAQSSKALYRTNADYYQLVANEPPLFKPGEREQYCNGCYVVLGEVIAKVSGMSYEAYIRDNIFKKAGMTKADFLQIDSVVEDVAVGYTANNGSLISNVLIHGAAGNAAGGSYATLRDLLKFDQALKNHALVDAAGTTNVIRLRSEESKATGDYAIAGGAPGANTVLISAGEWTVVVLTNRDPAIATEVGFAVSAATK